MARRVDSMDNGTGPGAVVMTGHIKMKILSVPLLSRLIASNGRWIWETERES